MNLKLVLISDTHNLHQRLKIPEGEVLIHAGDITRWGDPADLRQFNRFLGMLPHPYKIVIAGNHDFCLERNPGESEALLTNCIYLRDQSITLHGIKFYGSPWQPQFCNLAFNLKRGPELKAKWDLIPPDTDVLITHGPPLGYGDRTLWKKRAGCAELLNAALAIKPRLHVFGHIHEAAGIFANAHTTFVNASSCDINYRPINPPIIFEYERNYSS